MKNEPQLRSNTGRGAAGPSQPSVLARSERQLKIDTIRPYMLSCGVLRERGAG